MVLARIAGAGLLLLAAGCYESDEPLGPPEQGTVDRALLGTWRCINAEDKKESAHLRVIAFDRSQYYLEWNEDRKVDRYRAYSTQARDGVVYNVTELAADKPSWVFMRAARQKSGALSLAIVDKDSVKAKSAPAALKEIAERAADDALYRAWADCTKEE